MIKKILALFVIGISAGFLSSFVLGQHAVSSPTPDTFKIDSTKGISLNFNGAGVKVEGWDKDYIEVSSISPLAENRSSKSQSPAYKIAGNGNNISLVNYSKTKSTVYNLQTWASIMQFKKYRDQLYDFDGINIGMSTVSDSYDFIVHVPRSTPLNIKAEQIKAVDCSLTYTGANSAIIRESRILKGFISEGKSIAVKDCIVNNDSSFKNHSLEMKNNEYIKD